MTLLDRFRAQSRERHPDPAVRLAYVVEIPLDDRTQIAAPQLLASGRLDYMVLDYLAEVTMSLLARSQAKTPAAA